MWMCCEQHVELAIDMYVDERGKAPEISTTLVDEQSRTCDFCASPAAYIVGG